MRFAKLLFAALLSAGFLAGCGGGGGPPFGSPTSPGGTSSVATITVTASSATIAADDSTTSTITGILRDKDQNFVANAAVTFASSAGGLAIGSAKSDVNGQVTATLSATGAAAGTVITVSVTAGTITGSTKVTVGTTTRTLTLTTSAPQIPSDGSKSATITALVRDGNNNALSGVAVAWAATSGQLSGQTTTTDMNGLATATLGTASDPTNRTITVSAALSGATPVTIPVSVTGTVLNVTGPASIVTGNAATYTVQLSNSAGTGIPNQAVAVTSALGNTLSSATIQTNSTGQATVTLTATKGGKDTLKVTALSLTATQAIAVSSQSFAFTAPAPTTTAKIDLGVVYTTSVNWSNNGAPVVGSTVMFSTTRGTLSSNTATTDSTGTATVTISSANAGPGILTASGTAVTATANIDFVATNPSAITLQPSQTAVPTQGSATILAVVRDPAGNLVEGAQVQFVLTDVTNGTLSTGLAVTDDQGIAQTVYTASATSSAKDGVVIAASVLGFPSVTASTSLTVGGQTVFLSLGTGNTVDPFSEAEYSQDWAVRAIDAQGATVPNVQITIGVSSVSYYKGTYCYPGTTGCWATSGTDWVQQNNGGQILPECASEDLAGNGILEPGEDYNGNGQLDPGAVASISPGSGATNASGLLPFTLYYPKDHALWVKVKITASTVVTGTQSVTSSTIILPGLASDYSSASVSPPGATSPYGVAAVCSNPN